MPIANLTKKKYDKIAYFTEYNSISLLQSVIKEDQNIHTSLSPIDGVYLQELVGDCQIQSAHKVISVVDYQAIIDNAKSKLIDLFLDFNDTLFNGKIKFNAMAKKDEIQSIVTNNIYAGIYTKGTSNISGGNIVGGQGNNVNINAENIGKLRDITLQIEELLKDIAEDREDIALAILEINTKLDEAKKPKAIKLAFNSLKGVLSGVTNSIAQVKATVLVEKGIVYAGEIINAIR